MPFGVASQQGTKGEQISHIAAVRMRVTGSGTLRMRLVSLDGTETQELVPFTMQSATNREPLRLANFKQQRCYLRVYTTAIDEVFRINRYILFGKYLWNEYPGTE